jgi:metallophosphoesterase superfamily enzyme
MTDNVVQFHKVKRTKDPVPVICELAGENFKNVIIMGENHDGDIQMVTTVSDPAEVLWYMEAARFGIMTGNMEDE